MLVGQKNNQN